MAAVEQDRGSEARRIVYKRQMGPVGGGRRRGDAHRPPLERLNRLTDSVFALVMVIMVGKPGSGKLTEAAVLAYLQSQTEALILILITFLVVGLYWVNHSRQSRYLHGTDGIHTWLTLFHLVFVVILPFPNALSVLAPNSTASPGPLQCDDRVGGLTALAGLGLCKPWVPVDPSRRRSLDRSLH